MSVFKDFPGLENLEKKFKDFQGPTRALDQVVSPSHTQHVYSSSIVRLLSSHYTRLAHYWSVAQHNLHPIEELHVCHMTDRD